MAVKVTTPTDYPTTDWPALIRAFLRRQPMQAFHFGEIFCGVTGVEPAQAALLLPEYEDTVMFWINRMVQERMLVTRRVSGIVYYNLP